MAVPSEIERAEPEVVAPQARDGSFQPLEWHWRYLNLLDETESALSIREIGKRLEIDHTVVWKAHQDARFQRWLVEQREAKYKAKLCEVHKSLYLQALSGSAPHIQLFMKRFDDGFEPEKKPHLASKNSLGTGELIDVLCMRLRCSKEAAGKLLAGKAKIEEAPK